MADYSKMFHNYDDMFDGTPRELNPKPSLPKESKSPSLGSDLAYQATGSANSALAGLARTANTLFSDGIDGPITKQLDANAQYANDQLSPEQKLANQKQFISDKEGETFGSAVSDPRAYSGLFASALGSTAPSLLAGGALGAGLKGIAGVASKGLGASAKASGIANSVAGATGYGLSEAGAVAGGVSGDIQTTINTMPQAIISQSPRYQYLIKTMSDTEARGVLGREVGVQGMKDVALPTALLGTVAGRFIDKAITGKLTGASRLKNAGIGALTEAPTEAAQGGYEQYVKNDNLGKIDPSIKPFQGVPDASFKEGLGGAGIGGVIGGLSSVNNDNQQSNNATPSTSTPEPTGTEGLANFVNSNTNNATVQQADQQSPNNLINQFGLPITGDIKPSNALDLSPIDNQQNTNQQLSAIKDVPLEGELLGKQNNLNTPIAGNIQLSPIDGQLVTKKLGHIKALPAPEKSALAKTRKDELKSLLPHMKGYPDIERALEKDITVLSLIQSGKNKTGKRVSTPLLSLDEQFTADTETAKAFKANPDVYQKMLAVFEQQRALNEKSGKKIATIPTENKQDKNTEQSPLIYQDDTGEKYTHLGADKYQDASGEVWNFDKGELTPIDVARKSENKQLPEQNQQDNFAPEQLLNEQKSTQSQETPITTQSGEAINGSISKLEVVPNEPQQTNGRLDKNQLSGVTASDKPEILSKTKKSYLNKKLKDLGVRKDSPGYKDALERETKQYEADLEQAEFSLPFDEFKNLKVNQGHSDSILRQSYNTVRDELGIKATDVGGDIKDSLQTNEPKSLQQKQTKGTNATTNTTGTSEATHIEDGEIERVTPKVVSESLSTASENNQKKSKAEMKGWLVSHIDKAILNSNPQKYYIGEAKPTADNFEGTAVDYKTFDVPGDGKFKVLNTKEHLTRFKKKVLASRGFKDSKSNKNTTYKNRSANAIVEDFLNNGEYENAYYAAKASGISIKFGRRSDKDGDYANPYTSTAPIDLADNRKIFVGKRTKQNTHGKTVNVWNVIDENLGLSITDGKTKKEALLKAKLIGKDKIIQAIERQENDNNGKNQSELLALFKKEHGIVDDNLTSDTPLDNVISDKNRSKTSNVSGVDKPVKESKAQAKTSLEEKGNQPKQNVDKIKDFGEVLTGAKKHTYSFTKAMTDDIDIQALPLSKSFPKPNYVKLIEEGLDPIMAGFIAQVRGEIKSKPRRKGSKLDEWIKSVEVARKYTVAIINGNINLKDLQNRSVKLPPHLENLSDSYVVNTIDIASIAKDILPNQVEDLAPFKLKKMHFSLYEGEKNVTKWVVTNARKKIGMGSMETTSFDTKKQALDYIKDSVSDANKKTGKAQTKFDLWTERGKEGVFLGKKVASRKYIQLRHFDTSKEAREYKDTHYDELVTLLAKKKKIRAIRRIDNNPRVGVDYRGGKDITPKEFSDTFGFRGVQFGNWVQGAKRQQDLNNAYDGLMDLSISLNIPTQAVSLDGSLGLAFGARGRGGKNSAAAHYESNGVNINLTKINGSGSLAHEWFHALDNYFGKMDKGTEFLTEGERKKYKTIQKNGKKTFVETTDADFEVRKEVYDAWLGLSKAIKYETKLVERSIQLDKARSKDYWSTVREMTARSFERYIIDKLNNDGYSSDYLANIVSESAHNAENELLSDVQPYPYPLEKEMDAVNKAYDHLFSTLKTKKTDNGTALYSRASIIKAKPKGMPVEDVQAIAKQFMQDYNGNIPLKLRVVNTQEEAYGPNGTEEKIGVVKGAYHPKSGFFILAASNLRNEADARATMRHEILAHYGLNTFNKEDKKAILNKIIASKKTQLKEEWKEIEALYSDKDEYVQAEEVFAKIAENKRTFKRAIADKIISLVYRALRHIGLAKQPISRSELRQIIASISEGIRRGDMKQKTFPKSDDAQFSRASDAVDSIKSNAQKLNHWLNGEPLNQPVGGNLGLNDEAVMDKLIRLWQDGFNRINTLQKTIKARGGVVNDSNNVYLAEERSSGITSARLDDLRDNRVEPLVDAMKAKHITLEQLDDFVRAKHAAERNDYIASINPEMQDSGSGLSYQQAQKILSDFEQQGMTAKLESLADQVYAMNDQTLNTIVADGLIDDETYRQYQGQYQYYVPLKGKEGIDNRAGNGQGYSVSGAGIKKALGRGENNLSESPVAHSIAQAENAIIRAEKARVGVTLVKLMKDNPDPSFWTVTQTNYNKFIGLDGEVFEAFNELPSGLIENQDYHRTMGISPTEKALAKAEGRKPKAQVVYKLDPSYKFREDVFSVMIKGKLHQITIEDKVLAEQLKKLNSGELNKVFQHMGSVNRFLAMINTALNPEFVITNLERDLQTAGINIAGEHSAKMAQQVMKDVPKAVKGIWLSVFKKEGATTNEWSKLYQELKHEGGTIGFFGLEDIGTKVKKIEQQLTLDDSYLGKTKEGLSKIQEVILNANQSVENASRLAAYKAALDKGMSKKQAASLAKNLTVNFNRRGELAPALNSMYLFANASIQGTARIFTALKHPAVRKIVGGIASTSFILAMYNASAGGEDDDGVSKWEKVSDYLKQTNIIIMHPDGSGNYSKFKMPYGYNVFWYAGTALHDLMFGKNTTPLGQAGRLLTTAVNAFNPIQGADFLDTITPTILKPVEQDARNINFMMTPIRPDNPFDRYDRPDSDKAFNGTNAYLKQFAKLLNSATGGDDTQAGFIDISPESIKHYVGWLTGGAGMTITRTVGTASKLATGESIQAKEIPFIRTLGGSVGTHYDTERFYKAIATVEATKEQDKIYRDEHAPNGITYRKKNAAILNLSRSIYKHKKRLKFMRSQRNAAYRNGDYTLADNFSKKMAQEMRVFLRRYDQANNKEHPN